MTMTPDSLRPLSAYDLTRTTAPTTPAVTAAELRDHLRLDGTDQDTYLESLVEVAADEVEKRAGVALMRSTWTLAMDRFWDEGGLELPRAPLNAVTSITYTDADGADQTLSTDAYRVITDARPGRVHTAHGVALPGVRTGPRAVRIVYTAGHATAAEVPAAAKHAVKIFAAHLYANAELLTAGVLRPVPEAFNALVGTVRVRGAL